MRHGERVTYFASEPFRERVEATGATFKAYAHDLDMFKGPPTPGRRSAMLDVLAHGADTLADIFAQTQYRRFDFLVHSAPFPLTKPVARLLELPTVASHAVFAGLDPFFERGAPSRHPMLVPHPERDAVLQDAAANISRRFGIEVSRDLRDWILNPGDLNLVYTSRLFAGELPYFDESCRFVGPPVHERHESTDFPPERLAGRRVLDISLGTVFGNRSPALHDAFMAAFSRWDGVVVLAAYGVDTRGVARAGQLHRATVRAAGRDPEARDGRPWPDTWDPDRKRTARPSLSGSRLRTGGGRPGRSRWRRLRPRTMQHSRDARTRRRVP